MIERVPESKRPQTFAKAYKVCDALNAIRKIQDWQKNEALFAAQSFLNFQAVELAVSLGLTIGELYDKWNSYSRHINDGMALARIQSGQVDHAIIRYPAGVMREPVAKLRSTREEDIYGLNCVPHNLPTGEYDVYPRYTPVPNIDIDEDTGRVTKKVQPAPPTLTEVAKVTIHNGGIEQVLFDLDHGLPDGEYKLVTEG